MEGCMMMMMMMMMLLLEDDVEGSVSNPVWYVMVETFRHIAYIVVRTYIHTYIHTIYTYMFA